MENEEKHLHWFFYEYQIRSLNVIKILYFPKEM